jgi:hypothetical protein
MRGWMQVQRNAAGATIVLAILGACSPLRGGAKKAPMGEWHLFIDEQRIASDPRAATLMQWVVPLVLDGTTVCSATTISDHAVLTAAHCIDGPEPPNLSIGADIDSIRAADHRACRHGSCATPFPTGEYDRFAEDVATAWVDNAIPVASPPALADVTGDVAGAFMLSARTGHAHPVCRAYVSGGVGEVMGNVEKGDSGSSVVAVRPDGTPLILGVVSHRLTGGGAWYFASVGESVPWPDAGTAAGVDAPSIPLVSEADLSTIQDCMQ